MIADPHCLVAGQADWLRILIRNLVDNAVRYTPAGGWVQVSLKRAGGYCRLTVQDSGPGIPPDKRKQVLRRFHRIEVAEQPGSGLGLAIVSRIAELHACKLQLAGEPGAGLSASIELVASPA